jgi:phenylacetate-CoA ligase
MKCTDKNSCYQPEIECATRDKIRDIQDKGLRETVKRAYENSAYYRKKLDAHGVRPDDIKGTDDLARLPFTKKDDLREAYPYGLLCTPLADCIRIQSTSGTTGKRVIAFYTKNDIDLWENCCARAITAAGGTCEDIIQISYGYGLFTGGAGLNGGSHKLGALTVPMSSGSTDRQIQFMQDLGSTVLCCTPSYAAYLAETICERGLNENIKLKAGIFGAEAWTEEMRADIEAKLGIKAYDIYGLTELMGPGVAFECEAQDGLHINEDCFIVETIDPESGEILPEGSKGELVFTSLSKEAFPMIRYRTRDISILKREKCKCGRTHVKMAKPMGRSDDMLIIKGVNVFPSQIESVLIEKGYSPNYMLVVDRVNNSDTLEVNVEMTQEMFSDRLGEISAHEKELVGALKDFLGIYAKVKLVQPKSIARSEGKAVRIIDRRNLYKG